MAFNDDISRLSLNLLDEHFNKNYAFLQNVEKELHIYVQRVGWLVTSSRLSSYISPKTTAEKKLYQHLQYDISVLNKTIPKSIPTMLVFLQKQEYYQIIYQICMKKQRLLCKYITKQNAFLLQNAINKTKVKKNVDIINKKLQELKYKYNLKWNSCKTDQENERRQKLKRPLHQCFEYSQSPTKKQFMKM